MTFCHYYPTYEYDIGNKIALIMTKMSFLAVLSLIYFIEINSIWAQDPEFTQFYSNPLYLNPAMSGVKCPRVIANFRNQWTNIPGGSYQTYSISYDQDTPALHGGLGLLATNDITGGNTFNTTSISGIYTYVTPLWHKWFLRSGFQFTFMQRSLNTSELSYGDMIDDRYGFILMTRENINNASIQAFDLSTGLLIHNHIFYFGGAVHHLLEPNESFLGGTSKIPMKFTGHAGAKIPLLTAPYNVDDYISPNIIYRKQGTFNHLNFGLYITKGVLTGGVWYRGLLSDWESNDSFILLAGLRAKGVKLGYSYDITISNFGVANSGGSHEFSFMLDLKCKQKSPRIKAHPCPDF